MTILNVEFRILIFGSATTSILKRLTPIEFHKSAIGNQKSAISLGGEQ